MENNIIKINDNYKRKYDIIINILKKYGKVGIFDKFLVDWLFGEGFFKNVHKNKENNKIEKQLLLSTLKYFNIDINSNQWTNNLGEQIVNQLLKKTGNKTNQNVKIESPNITTTTNTYKLDNMTMNNYYEVKTRNYTTSGTAGEKVLGVHFKYNMIPKETGKDVKIVLVGFQEMEWKYKLLYPVTKYDVLDVNEYYNKGFEYIGCSELLYNYIIKYDLCKTINNL